MRLNMGEQASVAQAFLPYHVSHRACDAVVGVCMSELNVVVPEYAKVDARAGAPRRVKQCCPLTFLTAVLCISSWQVIAGPTSGARVIAGHCMHHKVADTPHRRCSTLPRHENCLFHASVSCRVCSSVRARKQSRSAGGARICKAGSSDGAGAWWP